MVEVLLKNGAKIDLKSEDEWMAVTPLFLAVINGWLMIIK